jgi:hypothetical protein
VSRLRVVQELHERDLLLPMLRRNRDVLRLGLVSRQHRAWPVVTSALADVLRANGSMTTWARLAEWDLNRRGQVDEARADLLQKRATELRGSEEFRRFAAQLPS